MVNNSLVDQPPGSAVPVAVVESVTFLRQLGRTGGAVSLYYVPGAKAGSKTSISTLI